MKKIILLLFIFIIGKTISYAQNSEQPKDTFPPTFGKGKTYLYVVTVPGYFQVNGALKKSMEKNYSGQYEVIDMRDFASVKAKKDVNTYVLEMIYARRDGSFTSGGRIDPETNYSCGVKDMATGTLYRLPYIGGNYKKVMDKYIKRLEEIRKANEAIK